MRIEQRIDDYFAAQPEPKRSELRQLHALMLGLIPGAELWFLDGKDESGRTVSNPSVGYGLQTTRLAQGMTREFYQVGISANTSGISVYLMGLDDRKFLAANYGARIGQARVTGYCIQFRRLDGVNLDVLCDAVRDALERTRG